MLICFPYLIYELVPKKLTNEKVLEMEQELIAERRGQRKENCRRKRRIPGKFTLQGLAEILYMSTRSFKSLKIWTLNTASFSLIEGMFMVRYMLTRKSAMEKRDKPSKPLWTYSEKTNTSSRRAHAGPSGGIPEGYYHGR